MPPVKLQVYNTMTRKREPFEPLVPGKVSMYVCGPTVYDSCHLGHARHGVVWDTVRRYLEYSGYEVTYVVNITDVDDKIIQRANEQGVDWREITSRYITEYLEDMASLGVRRPTIQPRATEHIDDMIEAVKGLVEKGHAYVVKEGEGEGSVYFSVETFADYGKLSKRKLDDETVARVEPDPNKRAPADFALWKASKPGEPAWDSPWGKGKGRPGWHIECSVMSAKYLGTPFDIHGGGADLIFPHHENEIAQAEAMTGRRFVRYWMHNEFVTVRSEKMSKSLGNFVTLRDLIGRYTGSAVRFFFLGAHYGNPIEFLEERLVEAAAALDRIYNCLEAVDRRPGTQGEASGAIREAVEDARRKFKHGMDDDFNTANAEGALFDLVRAINADLEQGSGSVGLAEAAGVLREFMGVLGLPPERERPPAGELEAKLIELLASVRGDARKAKHFDLADRVREEMGKLGLEIEDLARGESRLVRRVGRRHTD